jgi:hypothetical protein
MNILAPAHSSSRVDFKLQGRHNLVFDPHTNALASLISTEIDDSFNDRFSFGCNQ